MFSNCKHVIKYLIHALEKKVNFSDEADAGIDGQIELDFHIPAVTCWIRHDGQSIYNSLLRDDIKDWKKPVTAMQFEQPIQR